MNDLTLGFSSIKLTAKEYSLILKYHIYIKYHKVRALTLKPPPFSLSFTISTRHTFIYVYRFRWLGIYNRPAFNCTLGPTPQL
jgi:hypothetical protein